MYIEGVFCILYIYLLEASYYHLTLTCFDMIYLSSKF
jgi:hypothetical protein